MIKVDHFLRSAFHSQRADKDKMCEEPFHLRSPDKVLSLSMRVPAHPDQLFRLIASSRSD